MRIDVKSGCVEKVKFIASPHCNERPAASVIDLLVVHNISLPPNKFGGDAIEQFFQGKLDSSLHPFFKEIARLRVSSHIVIDRAGKITQYVPFHRRAWHAGESLFEGRQNCNDFSIGIELEGADHIAYEMLQYASLASLTKALMLVYPGITQDRIVGHSDIAPGRKTDPGPAFDWTYFRSLL